MATKSKKKKTFAQAAKEITDKYKNRLGEDLDKNKDKYAWEAMQKELEQLKQKQEAVREKKGLNQSEQQFNNGGDLPKKGGDQIGSQYINEVFGNMDTSLNFNSPVPATAQENQINPGVTGLSIGDAPEGEVSQNPLSYINQESNNNNANLYQTDKSPMHIGAGIAAAGNIANALIGDGDPDEVEAASYTPETVDYSEQREQSRAMAANSKREAMRRARNAGSGVDYVNNALAASTAIDRNLSNQLTQSNVQEQNTNVQIENQAGRFNAQQQSYANRMNTENRNRDRMMDAQRIRSAIGGLSQTAQGWQKDMNAADQYDNMIQALSDKYVMTQDENGNIMFKPKKNYT